MKTIFNSLVQEVLAILARIVAAKIFAFVLNLILPGAGTAAGIMVGGSMGGPSFAAATPIKPGSSLAAATPIKPGSSLAAATPFAAATPIKPGSGLAASAPIGAEPVRPPVRGNTTVNINAINARDVALSILSPLGELRRGGEAAALGGSY